MRYLTFIPILFALLIVAPLVAQDAPADTGWPIEQHCVGDPTPPPAGWTYDGTIFAYNSNEGIRGIRADLRTSYHVTYEGETIFNAAGTFSPDRKWFAVPVGKAYPPYTYVPPAETFYAINRIVVYGTNLERKVYTIPWKAGYSGSSVSVIPQIKWLDNERFVYIKGEAAYYLPDTGWQTYVVNPFTQEITTWVKPFNLLFASVAPDYSKALYYNYDMAAEHGEWGMYDFDSGKLLTIFKEFAGGVWTSDSTQLVGAIVHKIPDEKYAYVRTLALFDLAGNPQDLIFQYTKSSTSIALSDDTQYIAFDDAGNLFLADVSKKQIYDLCFQHFAYLKWSPDGRYLALTNNDKITVFDIESWELYELPYEIGEVVAWGAAD